jgi:ABC-type nitrate/sulfonate/bicarbonate transport system ATPase subunit
MNGADNIIEVRQYSRKFENRLSVFENVSFEIGRGEIVSIVGPSGSGKSTLLRSIIGLDNGYSGSIRICGKDRGEYLKEKRIAFVLQKYSNFHWMNVYENVADAFHNKTIGLKEEQIISSILEELGLSGFENYYINQLSGGMQQRLAVARALIQDTNIIAMDEPFGALDMKIREELQVLIKKINDKHKKTVLFVTHDIEEALFLSDKIIMLSKIPVKSLKIFGSSALSFKKEENPAVKYEKNFFDMRREIEVSLVGDEEPLSFILRKLND